MKQLVGKWIKVDGKIVGDDVEKQIDYLISTKLMKIAHRDSGWTLLYRDPDDSSYWELTYPLSEMQGGGPSTLTEMSLDEVIANYGCVPS